MKPLWHGKWFSRGGGGGVHALSFNLLTFISDKGVHMHFKTLPTVLLFSASLFIIAD